MIRELGTKDRYYIIDINYFPGVSLFCHLYLGFVLFVSVLYLCPCKTCWAKLLPQPSVRSILTTNLWPSKPSLSVQESSRISS
ncbi:Inositol-tetrakisphosphate 1-kinase 3 [Zea mays]|nr:Inositol-tetrakisphosphate 1-kinase 3 [Zea mays]